MLYNISYKEKFTNLLFIFTDVFKNNMNQDQLNVLLITISDLKFSFPVDMINRVILAQEITPYNNSEGNVMGLINLHGEVIPVVSLRRRFSLPETDLTSSCFFLIISFKSIKVALIADSIEGLEVINKSDIKFYKDILPGMSELEFFTKSDCIYYIYNAENLLSKEEEETVRNLYSNEV